MAECDLQKAVGRQGQRRFQGLKARLDAGEVARKLAVSRGTWAPCSKERDALSNASSPSVTAAKSKSAGPAGRRPAGLGELQADRRRKGRRDPGPASPGSTRLRRGTQKLAVTEAVNQARGRGGARARRASRASLATASALEKQLAETGACKRASTKPCRCKRPRRRDRAPARHEGPPVDQDGGRDPGAALRDRVQPHPCDRLPPRATSRRTTTPAAAARATTSSASHGCRRHRDRLDHVRDEERERPKPPPRTATRTSSRSWTRTAPRKACEYAVLVSLLEPESELYNTGIVDMCRTATRRCMWCGRSSLCR